jgi:hypothetical protein
MGPEAKDLPEGKFSEKIILYSFAFSSILTAQTAYGVRSWRNAKLLLKTLRKI